MDRIPNYPDEKFILYDIEDFKTLVLKGVFNESHGVAYYAFNRNYRSDKQLSFGDVLLDEFMDNRFWNGFKWQRFEYVWFKYFDEVVKDSKSCQGL